MNEIRKLTIRDLVSGIVRQDFSLAEVRETFLEAIKYSDLNAFVTVCEEESGRTIEKLFTEGEKKLPLYGMPVAIKDSISTKNIRTTCASKILENYIPPFNATVVEKLLKAGSYVLAKTNLDEFMMGSSGENSYFGATKNPWCKERVAGGSSSGTVAAVASGLVPYALGSDTGGSIRQPAAFCGVMGLKPTYGRISRYGLVAFASSLDQIGICSHTAEDLALVLQELAGQDAKDAISMAVEVPTYTTFLNKDIKGLKIGLPKEYFLESVQSEIKSALAEAIKIFTSLGSEVVDISLPHTEASVATYYLISCAEASSNLSRYDGVRYGYQADDIADITELYCKTRSAGFGTEVKRRILLGTYVLSKGYCDKYYLRAQKVRRLIANDFDSAFKECDFILTPVTPTTAFKFGEFVKPLQMYMQDIFTVPASLAGLPALSLPCGFDKANLPIGMQLLAKHWNEGGLLQMASAYQSCTTWHRQVCF